MNKKVNMNNINSKNTLGVERVKVDMNSTWAKTVLIPALKEIRENPARPWTMVKVPLNLSILISPSFAILIINGVKLSRLISAMAISNAGMDIIPLNLLMQKDINGLGAGSLMD